jgi:hypothetical protein
METASNLDIYINTTQYRIYFWFHYNLLKPCAKGNTVHLPYCQENGLQATKGLKLLKTIIEMKRFEETVEKALTD